MNTKTIVAALLGLAVTGCAHTRKAKPPADEPISMKPIPSLHDTINRGENPVVARSVMADPESPNWSGRATPSNAPAELAPPRVATTAAGKGAAGAAAVLTPNAPPAPFPKLAPEVAYQPQQPQASPPPRVAAVDPTVSPSSITRPSAAELPAPLPPGNVIDSPALPPVADDLGISQPPTVGRTPRVAGGGPAAAPDLSKPLQVEPYTSPLDFIPETPPASPAAGPAPTAPAQPSSPSASSDPLLGPSPELMPASLGSVEPTTPAANPTGAANAPKPIPSPPPAPAPGPAPAPAVDPATAPALDPAPTIEPPALSPAGEPSAAALPVEPSTLPELSPSPALGGGLASVPVRTPEPATAGRPAPRIDREVRQASTDKPAPAPDDEVIDPKWRRAGETVAWVGDEVITMRELTVGVKDQLKRLGVKASEVPRAEMNMLAQSILANLIDRSLLYQEARRELKDKKLTELFEISDKVWREEELPQHLRANHVQTEQQLRAKMEESGRSLDAFKSAHRQEFIAMLYIQQKLRDRMNVELPEMLRYYNDHMNDEVNHRTATTAWREIVVETAKHSSPAEARKKAEGLLAKLQGGEDFARLAKAESEGPSAVKAQGGLMETSPGGYGVAAVNQAIETLPLNTLSGIVEGPSSFHIVRVESRRPAGPASFAELQDQIRREIFAEKSQRERRQLLDKLHSHSLISTIFDGTDSDPNQARR